MRVCSSVCSEDGGAPYSASSPQPGPAPLCLPISWWEAQAERRTKCVLGGREGCTGGQAPQASWLNPKEWREETAPSHGGPLPPGTGGKGTGAFVLRGMARLRC